MEDEKYTTDGFNQPEGFIDKKEVARRLGRSLRTVDAWMRRGILPYYKPDRRVMFRWKDVEEHIVRQYRCGGRTDS